MADPWGTNLAMAKKSYVRPVILVSLMLGITCLHYLTTTQKAEYHDIYRRLYYIPIILGGLWYALRGGVATSIAISILYAPHVVFQWGHHPGVALEQYLEILLYNLIGFLTGILSQREIMQRVRAEKAARRLEESYAKLREQADLVLEIEEQLRRADRLSALGELSAGMAHEIRNPLGSIRGTAEILKDGIDPADKRYEFAQILIREVDRLNRVVQDFLDFSRPVPPRREPFDIVEVLNEVLTLTRQPALKNQVRVVLEGEGRLAVPGDREQLKQAFLNLVLNALQAMPEGGTLTVSVTVEKDDVRIRFTDTGQGIPRESLDRVFNPFFTTRSEGTGLGLAITHRIVQGHGGRIDVDSRLGEGTVFTLHLPLPAAAN